MNNIEKLKALEISDSRGNPTLKVSVFAGGLEGSFEVPSGASTGVHEAYELRDSDGGMKNSIDKAENTISKEIAGFDIFDQKKVDQKLITLDGTKNKTNLGGNTMLGVSLANVKLAARLKEIETFEYLRTLSPMRCSRIKPYLFVNLINGGKHAENDLAFQEYQVVIDNPNTQEAIETAEKIQSELKEIISAEVGEDSLVLGDEGGFAPKLADVRKPLAYLARAIENAGFFGKVRLGLDVAANSFYKDGVYHVGGKDMTVAELFELYASLIKEFDIFSIEDPFHEEDFEAFFLMREKFPELIVVGDDLTVTNKSRLEKAIGYDAIDALIIKPNQVGTFSEMLETMELAEKNNIKMIVSHRSGETMDDFIADLVYAYGCFGLKAGSPIKKERRVKYERLKQIAD